MKLILRDYLASLKEEGELDVLITDLLFAKKITPLVKTQKGVRQYGVDIIAKGKDNDGILKLFIVTVKKGDINRRVWDTGAQAVRPSLNEIQDVYVPSLPKSLKPLPCKIIVATNGVMSQDVEMNWNAYINRYSKKGLDFEFWDINYLAIELEENLLNEYLVQNNLKNLLQKTLSLIDVHEYDLRHYYKLIDQILFEQKIKNQKDIIRRLRVLKTCQAMLLKWGRDGDNLKNVYISSERFMIAIAELFRKEKLFEKKKLREELLSIHLLRTEIGIEYFEKIKSHCYIEHAFSTYTRGSEIEYSLLIFEQMGIIAQIGLECWSIAKCFKPNSEPQEQFIKKSFECTDALWNLMDNNPASCYVLYDDQVIDISLAMLLFYYNQQFDAGYIYINRLIHKIGITFNTQNFFPLFNENYDKLLDIQLGQSVSEPNSSHLFPMLIEWSLAFGSLGNYDLIQSLIKSNFPNLNLQIWFPDKGTEDFYFSKNSLHESGNALSSIEVPEDYRDYLKRVQQEYNLFTIENEFYLTKRLGFLPLLAARHFRYLVFPIYWRRFLMEPYI